MGRNNKTGGRMLHQPTTSIASHQLRIFQLGSIRDTCYFPHVALAPTEPTRNCSATVMHCHFSTRRIGKSGFVATERAAWPTAIYPYIELYVRDVTGWATACTS